MGVSITARDRSSMFLSIYIPMKMSYFVSFSVLFISTAFLKFRVLPISSNKSKVGKIDIYYYTLRLSIDSSRVSLTVLRSDINIMASLAAFIFSFSKSIALSTSNLYRS